MAVKRAVDRNLTPKERLHRLLGQMLDQNVSDITKKKWALEFEQIVEGRKINSTWLSEFGLKATTGVDGGMGYIDIFVPPEAIPPWYRKAIESGKAEERPKVRFYLTMMETNGSASDTGVGPVNPKDPIKA